MSTFLPNVTHVYQIPAKMRAPATMTQLTSIAVHVPMALRYSMALNLQSIVLHAHMHCYMNNGLLILFTGSRL